MFGQHRPTAPGEQGLTGRHLVVALTAKQKAKPIGGTQDEKPNISKTQTREYENYLNRPSIVTLGLFGQNSDDSVLMAVSAVEVGNYTGNTTSNNSLACTWTAEHSSTTSTTLPG